MNLKNIGLKLKYIGKTCQECYVGVSEGNGIIYPDDPKHKGHEWSVIKTSGRNAFIFVSQIKLSKNT